MNALISLADLHMVHDEPRVQDLRLAEALGFRESRAIRKIIERNISELQGYGGVWDTASQTSPKGGRPGREYWLNEPQALLICMFSRTERARNVRQQLIEVFMAWRHGRLTPPAPVRRDPLDAAFALMIERLGAIEALLGFDEGNSGEKIAASITHLPIWTSGRRPLWWSDNGIRALLTTMHRQATIDQARATVIDRFGRARAPSRSSIHRYWQKLDAARGHGGAA